MLIVCGPNRIQPLFLSRRYWNVGFLWFSGLTNKKLFYFIRKLKKKCEAKLERKDNVAKNIWLFTFIILSITLISTVKISKRSMFRI